MTTSKNKKIAFIIFHIVVLICLFVSFSLLLDDIFTQDSNPNPYVNSFDLSFARIMSPFATGLGLISWLIIVTNWIKNGGLDFYLKSIFLTTSLLIIGLILLLLV